MYEGSEVFALRKLGETGFDAPAYQPPVVGLDSVLRRSNRAIIRHDIRTPEKRRQIERWGIDPETLPDRVVVLGSIYRYDAGPCKSGTLSHIDVHYVALDAQGGVEQKTVSADVFFAMYRLQKEESETGTPKQLLR